MACDNHGTTWAVFPDAGPYGVVHLAPADVFRLPPEMCRSLRDDMAEFILFNHAGVYQTDRHQHYPTTDLDLIQVVDHNRGMSFTNMVQPILRHMAGIFQIPPNLHLTLTDFFFAKYEPAAQQSLDRHTDGTLLTFVINLTRPHDDYVGGTLLVGDQQRDANLREVSPPFGRALCFAGGLLGHTVTPVVQGLRHVLVGFVEICHEQRVPSLVLKDWCSRLSFEMKKASEGKGSRSGRTILQSVIPEVTRIARRLPPPQRALPPPPPPASDAHHHPVTAHSSAWVQVTDISTMSPSATSVHVGSPSASGQEPTQNA